MPRPISLVLLLLLLPLVAHAQPKTGFQIGRYEPTAAGEWSLSVDHPWYSSTRYFAGGITLNYGHRPLVLGRADEAFDIFRATRTIIEHQLVMHVDLAGSLFDRVLLTASLPVVLLETGSPFGGVTPQGGVVGDPRFGLWVRLFGQPYRGPISMSLGADVWVPLRKFTDSLPQQASDQEVRFAPKLHLGGLARNFFWSFNTSFMYRAEAVLGTFSDPDGSSAGSELRFGLALGYGSQMRRLAIAPEFTAATVLIGGRPFTKDFTSVEALLAFHYNIAHLIQISAGAGAGLLRQPGTPDARAVLRLSYAPIRRPPDDRDRDGVPDKLDRCPDVPKGDHPDPARLGCPLGDRDGDGVFDPQDKCPDEPMGKTPDPALRGCPLRDRDGDGVFDKEDVCPDVHKGQSPDPQKPGCPLNDRDGDGVFDREDLCPDEPQGLSPDPEKKGCPLADRDKDGVIDREDVCPDEAQGPSPDPARKGCPLADRDKDGVIDREDICPDTPKGDTPDPARKGCPLGDRDGDGVMDNEDQCPDVPKGPVPDPAKKGCPAGDRDGDQILDPVDACPDQPGAPSPDPKKHGCPGLVKLEGGKLVIMNPVFFATDEDVILEKSFPVLQAVADALKASPQVRKMRIEGHTDNKGKADHNMDLSDRRAKSVRKFLIDKGIEAARLEAQGFGPTQPIQSNKSAKGRAANRRVDFIITDPPYSGPKVDPSQISSPDESDGRRGKGKKGKKAKAGKAGKKKGKK